MQARIAFCNRCRGMRVGWNGRFLLHCVLCSDWRRHSSRLVTLGFLTLVLVLIFPEPTKPVFSGNDVEPARPQPTAGLQENSAPALSGAAVRATEAFLNRYKIPEAVRSRVANAIVMSARKHDVDPRLIASVVVVESRGNPFAISGKDAIGVMQIHLPTWGNAADRENLNLLKIEDNIDFGARILKSYIRQFGRWEGIKRYNGFIADNPQSEQSAEEYAAKVQRVYSD
jgi:soluble lytic murein transglycosylase-like protein